MHVRDDTKKPQPAEAKTPEQEREEMLKLVNNPLVKKNALTVAKDFEATFRGNWFDVTRVMKKTKFKEFEQAFNMLNILCLVGLAYRKAEDEGPIKYKIVMNKNARILLLKEEIDKNQKAIDAYNAEIERLNTEE